MRKFNFRKLLGKLPRNKIVLEWNGHLKILSLRQGIKVSNPIGRIVVRLVRLR